MKQEEYLEKVYAGVLGKMIGVFYGRPVEGWPYEKIRKTFGMVERYIHKEAGTPLIVADDDLAGTFVFLKAVEDCAEIRNITSEAFGDAWLDYIIENKTIFWWGGLGRSTEHTAYLRLKNGIRAPLSGSSRTNGTAVSEQIGAQIFMDGLAMMCPGDPLMARRLVRESAMVSHDGIAVESACLLAGMEAMAFTEQKIDLLLDESIRLGMSDRMKKIVDAVREECAGTKEFRKIRDWLNLHYGYRLYPGNCHVIPNLALILACLILGENDFAKGMNYCVSAGWDTDCNAANLGCLNAIRLGLADITASYDYRSPLADRFYQISSDGGSCMSNAEKETYRIASLKNRLYGEEQMPPMKQFSFSLPGSVQGFSACSYLEKEPAPAVNGNQKGLGNGIRLEAHNGKTAVSTPVMWEKTDRQSNYCLTGSPLLYEGQTVTAEFRHELGEGKIRLYIISYDFYDCPILTYSETYLLSKDQPDQTVQWKIPQAGGKTIARVGAELLAETEKTVVLLQSMDWDKAPEKWEIRGSLRDYDRNGFNMMMEAFVSSAKQYSFDSRVTFTISHPEQNGIVTTGTDCWKNYSVQTTLIPGIHKRFGLVGRCRGHRRFYGLVFWENQKMAIIRKKGSEEELLAVTDLVYECDKRLTCCLQFCGERISAFVNENKILDAFDRSYKSGGAGFLIEEGTVLADGFCIESLEEQYEKAGMNKII